jgi:putative ABC transport system permease protein
MAGDPMVFISLNDAQEAQFLKDNDTIWQNCRQTQADQAVNRPRIPGLLDAVLATQNTNNQVNAVLVRLEPGHASNDVAESIQRWKRLTAYTRTPMKEILVGKITATYAAPYVPSMSC